MSIDTMWNSNKNVDVGKYAIDGIMNGISMAAMVVKSTMGAAGKNVIIEEDLYPFHRITNDGATIIKSLQFTDRLEKRGLAFLQEATDRSNANSGDGSSTTVTLVEAILYEGIKSGLSGMEIKRSIDELLPVIEKEIDKQTQIIDIEGVRDVATISGESEELGEVLTEIYRHVGKDGFVTLEGSGTFDTSYDLIEGVKFYDAGYLSPYLAHDDSFQGDEKVKATKAIYKNPHILVTKRKMTSVRDIDSLVRVLKAQGSSGLVIFTDDMDSNVAKQIIESHKQGVMNILIIRAPYIYKQEAFEDFAKATGATILEDASGVDYTNLRLEHLGTCDKLITDKDETTLLGIKDISDHIADLKKQNDVISKMRVKKLTTKTAVLRIGAKSENELSYKMLKAEDAIHASKHALQTGIVAGGGVCLRNVSREMPYTSGGNIMREALKSPIKQIWYNASIDCDMSIVDSMDIKLGWDTKKLQVVNMLDAKIVDSALVVKNAVRNAIGVASTILTSSAVISKPEKTAEQIASEALAQKGARPF